MKTAQNTKKRFYIYSSWEEQFSILTPEEQATMLMNLFKYQRGEEPILDTTGLKLVWAGMKFLLEQDDIKYQAAVQRAKNTKPQKQLMAPQKSLMEPQIQSMEPQNKLRNHTDNVNVNVNDNANDKVNVNVNEKDKVNVDENINVKMKSHVTSSIPGVFKPDMSKFEELFGDL